MTQTTCLDAYSECLIELNLAEARFEWWQLVCGREGWRPGVVCPNAQFEWHLDCCDPRFRHCCPEANVAPTRWITERGGVDAVIADIKADLGHGPNRTWMQRFWGWLLRDGA